MNKKEVRKEVLKIRDAITPQVRNEKSKRITERVLTHTAFQDANTLLLYAAFRSEVDATGIFTEAVSIGKKVCFPRVHGNEMEFYQVENETDFEESKWGIREPKIEVCKKYESRLKEKVCVIMPGAVFDSDGNRIGYGGGYYDKYLQKLDGKIVYKMAIAFEEQIVEAGVIQKEDHDIRVDGIITDGRIILIN